MNNFVYCECGARTVKGSTTVNFCPTCGAPFNKTNKIIKAPIEKKVFNNNFTIVANQETATPESKIIQAFKAKKQNKIIAREDIDNDDDGDDTDSGESVNSMPEITENPFLLQVEKAHGIKIGDIAGSKTELIPINKMNLRPAPPKKTRKQFLEEFKAEAGTLRPRNRD